mmetsp:Transcript_18253/g.25718  ORF Transcript_18253/g.25718 Transcript_18253/m.25718 type:complete len:157 (+) Transcript_18253:56-526(+)
MARFTIVALLATLMASANGFMVSQPNRMTSTKLNLMSTEESDKLLVHAADCVEGECSLDEVGDLIDVLKGQQSELYKRVEDVKKMVKTLEHVNGKDDREVDEVRETVRAIFRVFQLGAKASGNDYPALSKPAGFSGEVGDGPTDAYKSLDPKPWKP